MNKANRKNIKNNGVIYTPDFIVKNILDIAEYHNNKILEKHIIDNSCGKGSFLVEIVNRYCKEFFKKYDKTENNKKILKKHLETYIHGIEIEKESLIECIFNLDEETKKFNLPKIKWALLCENTLSIKIYENKMDFVVGNPPYVRVHNLNENYDIAKSFQFTKNGMTDLYIAFFEIGLKMLNNQGKMCLITPSSFLKSNAGSEIRNYILEKQNLTKVVDLGHFQPFNATTYTAITLFETNKKNQKIQYYSYDKIKKEPQKEEELYYSDVFIGKKIYLSRKEKLKKLNKIETSIQDQQVNLQVKNGFATLADKIFIGDFDFHRYVIHVLKASTGKWYKCIFPYDKEGITLDIEKIKKDPKLYKYLITNKERLKRRSLEKKEKWWVFGRSQGIKDVFRDKIAVNTTIKNVESIKVEFIPAGKGLYSGLYILSDTPFQKIKKWIKSNEFIEYLELLKNYKSGGYYTFSSLDLKKFLIYKINQQKYEK